MLYIELPTCSLLRSDTSILSHVLLSLATAPKFKPVKTAIAELKLDIS